mmetsp:Transcript_22124/g.68688  ORF Transcript_22124/g.68688 Transcript_22124/m.68688 type:complete len:266 (+) Transcript_22124:228-1025(+)
MVVWPLRQLCNECMQNSRGQTNPSRWHHSGTQGWRSAIEKEKGRIGGVAFVRAERCRHSRKVWDYDCLAQARQHQCILVVCLPHSQTCFLYKRDLPHSLLKATFRSQSLLVLHTAYQSSATSPRSLPSFVRRAKALRAFRVPPTLKLPLSELPRLLSVPLAASAPLSGDAAPRSLRPGLPGLPGLVGLAGSASVVSPPAVLLLLFAPSALLSSSSSSSFDWFFFLRHALIAGMMTTKSSTATMMMRYTTAKPIMANAARLSSGLS